MNGRVYEGGGGAAMVGAASVVGATAGCQGYVRGACVFTSWLVSLSTTEQPNVHWVSITC